MYFFEKIAQLMKLNLLILLLFVLIPNESNAQDSSRIYLNAGYITNLEKCSECEQADTGGSIRIGILTKGKFGFYAGYLWFKEYHLDYIEYDDKGSAPLIGINYRLLTRGNLQLYVNLGLEIEKFTSTYPNRTEDERNIKPDFGLLFNINHVNAYLGWQPSEPPHINIGIGFTF